MPRVHYRKARKAYPIVGIEVGDMYYTWRIRSTYGGTTYRSKERPKPSQLTNSPFKSGYLSAVEIWEDSSKSPEDARGLAEALREVGQEAQESFDNMPEGLQQGDTGQLLEERAYECESKADEIDGYADELEAAVDEEKAATERLSEAEGRVRDAENDEAEDDAQIECDDAQGEIDSARESADAARDEIDQLAEDMPE